MTETYIVWFLRIVHILSGVIWVGGTLIMTFFIAPAIGATGDAGQKFLGHLMGSLKFSNRMATAAGLTITAGFLLYLIRSDLFRNEWVQSDAATGFGIGAAFALVGFVFGLLIGRTTTSMAALGAQFKGSPSTEQLAQMQALRKQQATYSYISATSLILAVIFMAVARFIVF